MGSLAALLSDELPGRCLQTRRFAELKNEEW
jgi:hypothetical protein